MARFPELGRFPHAAIDLETTGLAFWKDRIFGVAVSLPGDRDYYWDVRDTPRVMDWLRDEMSNLPVFINHNAKFDVNFLIAAGVPMPRRVECTMVRAALLDEHLLKYDLDYLGKKYLGVGKDEDIYEELARIFGGRPTRAAQIGRLPQAPVELVARYAKQDTRVALQLWEWQEAEIERQGLRQVVELETELLPVLIEMEQGGVRVDVPAAERAVHEITRIVEQDQRELNAAAGFEVNPNPSGSIHRLFEPKRNELGQWVLIDGTIAESTDAGKASINADCLRRMRHPLAAKILKVRKLMKARDTFILGHVLGHHHNGVVHANFNQTKNDADAGTGTGRLSVTAPALQQISARDKEIAAIVRALFVPDEGCDWVSIDWAQVDFRVAAHYVKDPAIMKAYADDPDADFHQLTADLTGLPRSPRFAGDPNSKQINLGLAFGMGSGKLAAEMGLPYTTDVWYSGRGCAACADHTCKDPAHVRHVMRPGPEAEAVFEKYHGAMPGIRSFMEQASSVAKTRKYVRSLYGRHLRFPGGNFSHKAAGLLYQSGAADMQKIKIIECHRLAKETGLARLMLSVHDELNFSTATGQPDVVRRLNEAYCDFNSDTARLRLRVPIRSSVGIGPNWWEASK